MSAPRRVAVVGAVGRMGQEVRSAVSSWSGTPGLEVGGALEAPGSDAVGSEIENGTKVASDPAQAFTGCDVAIDFSVPAATLSAIAAAAETGTAYITGTTGFDDAGLAAIAAAAERVPVIHAPNFSVSVNVLAWLVQQAAAKLGADYDAELFEMHHNQKRDAPSGTALRLAEAVAEGREVALRERLVTAREGEPGARTPGEIGVQTLRGGDVAGEHTVMFVGQGERLELTHRASTRGHFARGAVRAAAWVVGRPPGMYRIEEALGL